MFKPIILPVQDAVGNKLVVIVFCKQRAVYKPDAIPFHTTAACGAVECTALLFLNLGTGWRRVVSFMSRPV